MGGTLLVLKDRRTAVASDPDRATIFVADLTPFMHDGCARTLLDRFTACGASTHGKTGQLTASQRADLIAFLETL
jgi:hypothetical protein